MGNIQVTESQNSSFGILEQNWSSIEKSRHTKHMLHMALNPYAVSINLGRTSSRQKAEEGQRMMIESLNRLSVA